MTDPITAVLGTWSLTIATPVGRLPITLALLHTDGSLHGSATSRHETVPLRDVVARAAPDGIRLTWHQAVTRPMRLNLAFDVLATADTLTGVSKAGRLPRSTVTGNRETAGITAAGRTPPADR